MSAIPPSEPSSPRTTLVLKAPAGVAAPMRTDITGNEADIADCSEAHLGSIHLPGGRLLVFKSHSQMLLCAAPCQGRSGNTGQRIDNAPTTVQCGLRACKETQRCATPTSCGRVSQQPCKKPSSGPASKHLMGQVQKVEHRGLSRQRLVRGARWRRRLPSPASC